MWIPYLQIFDISFRELSFLHFTQVWTVESRVDPAVLSIFPDRSEDEAQHDRRKEARKILNANVILLGKNKDESFAGYLIFI